MAVDRAFVDAVRGVGDDVRVPYAEALRTHRVALRGRRVGGDRRAGAVAGRRWSDRAVTVPAPGIVEIRERHPPTDPCRDGDVPGRSRSAGVSAGTELSYVKGTNPALSSRLGRGPRAVHAGRGGSPYPVSGSATWRSAGSRPAVPPPSPRARVVAMTYGHRTAYLADPLRRPVRAAARRPRPDARHLRRAHGPDLRQRPAARRRRPARRRRARRSATASRPAGRRRRRRRGRPADRACSPAHHGAASVVVLDPTPDRRAVAAALGLEALDPDGDEDPAVVLKTRWRHAAGRPGRRRGVPVPGPGVRPAPRAAAAAAPGHGDRPGLLPGAARTRSGSARSSTTTGWRVRCAQIGRVPRGLAPAWDRERLSAATIDLLRAVRGGRSASTWSRRSCRSTRRRSCSTTWPPVAGRSFRWC